MKKKTEEPNQSDLKDRSEVVSSPQKALFAFTRKEFEILKGLREPGQERGPLNGITQVVSWPDLLLAGPILGAPQAAMVMELLRFGGVRSFFSLGWCGSLQPDLTIGQVVLPETALSEEGTSAHYLTETGPPSADPGLSMSLTESLTRMNVEYRKGCVWTTDAPFRETKEKILTYSEQGILAVDMESSALMAVARFRGLAWSGLMVVSDEPWTGETKISPNRPEFTEGLTRAAEAVMDAIKNG